MSNVQKGHDYEREVKAMFIEYGWRCTRAAKSNEPADTIAYIPTAEDKKGVIWLFQTHNYAVQVNTSTASPFAWVAVRKTEYNIRKTYLELILGERWTVVLMQQKIYKRRGYRKVSDGARG